MQVVERIDIAGIARARAVDLDHVVVGHERTRTDVALQVPGLGPERAAHEDGVGALARPLWAAARSLTGDAGARQLMDGSETEVDCTGTGDPVDVDTLDDLRSLEEIPNMIEEQ